MIHDANKKRGMKVTFKRLVVAISVIVILLIIAFLTVKNFGNNLGDDMKQMG